MLKLIRMWSVTRMYFDKSSSMSQDRCVKLKQASLVNYEGLIAEFDGTA